MGGITIVCPYCDREIPKGRIDCPYCDKAFSEAVKDPKLREFMKRYCSDWVVKRYVKPEDDLQMNFPFEWQRKRSKGMRSEKEIRELSEELEKLTGFISEFGTEEEFKNEDVTFSNNVFDAFLWVLEETSTEDFRGDTYLNITKLKRAAQNIESRTGKKLENYE